MQHNYVTGRPFMVALVLIICVNAALTVAGILGVGMPGRSAWIPIALLLVASSAWVYVTHRNARALGASGFRFSAGSAALLIAIPFANLYASRMIYQELSMLCSGTAQRPSRLVLVWWRLLMFGLVLTVGLGVASAFRPVLLAPSVVLLGVYPLVTMALYAVIVVGITRRQIAARARHLALSDAAPAATAPAGAMPRLSLVNLEGILGVSLVLTLIVGIPAFLESLKYTKKERRNVVLERLYRSARELQAEGGLPESIGPTPPLGTCCSLGGGRCLPNIEWWSAPSWTALGFYVDEAHAESYEFVRDGNEFKVIAYADVDCDTTYAKFEMSSTGNGAIVAENPRE